MDSAKEGQPIQMRHTQVDSYHSINQMVGNLQIELSRTLVMLSLCFVSTVPVTQNLPFMPDSNPLQATVLHANQKSQSLGSIDWEKALEIYRSTNWGQELVTMEGYLSAGSPCSAPSMTLTNQAGESLEIIPREDDTISIKYSFVETKKLLGLFNLKNNRRLTAHGLSPADIEPYFRSLAQSGEGSLVASLQKRPS